MKSRLLILFSIVLCALYAHADVLVLRTGKSVEGTILLDNEQVVIIRDKQGSRFQYPKTDVLEIRSGEGATAPVAVPESSSTSETYAHKVSLGVEVRGGLATTGENRIGGAVGADLMVGTARIGQREVMLGIMAGYEGRWVAGAQAHFLPIQAAVRIPLMDTHHAPFIGANMGYGIGLMGAQGGLHAGAGLGYRCRMGEHSVLMLGADVTWQQTSVKQTTMQSITDADENTQINEYTTEAHNLLEVGLKLGFLF